MMLGLRLIGGLAMAPDPDWTVPKARIAARKAGSVKRFNMPLNLEKAPGGVQSNSVANSDCIWGQSGQVAVSMAADPTNETGTQATERPGPSRPHRRGRRGGRG